MLFGAIFGAIGVVVATPLLAICESVVAYLYVERRLGKPYAAALAGCRRPTSRSGGARSLLGAALACSPSSRRGTSDG